MVTLFADGNINVSDKINLEKGCRPIPPTPGQVDWKALNADLVVHLYMPDQVVCA